MLESNNFRYPGPAARPRPAGAGAAGGAPRPRSCATASVVNVTTAARTNRAAGDLGGGAIMIARHSEAVRHPDGNPASGYESSPAPMGQRRASSMRPSRPFTIAVSAHPGLRRDDRTSNVYLPYDSSSGMY